MNKCLRLTIIGIINNSFYLKIQKFALNYAIEGVAQEGENDCHKIIIHGHRDSIDMLLDMIHDALDEEAMDTMEIEPFIKDKDYRGVFRIIKK